MMDRKKIQRMYLALEKFRNNEAVRRALWNEAIVKKQSIDWDSLTFVCEELKKELE
jgi:hypothetical protein